MYTLFIDTHSEFITVALLNDNKVFLSEKESNQSHSIYLVPMINELMVDNNISFKDIKNVVAVNGPGSFTGIRIGLSVVKTISYSLNIPVYLVSSLEAQLVSSSLNSDKMAVISDSKGYYISVFDKNNNEVIPEVYMEEIDELRNKYTILDGKYDISKIVHYALKKESTNVFSIKANYVKTIEVMNDRK